MDIQEQCELLREIELFKTLTDAQLKLLAFTCEVLQYNTEEYLCHKDEEPDAVYVVLSGNVQVRDETGGKLVVLDDKSVGGLIGEMAVLRGEPRSASVRAIANVEVLKIPNDRFMELITSNEKLARYVMKVLADKVALASAQLSRSVESPDKE